MTVDLRNIRETIREIQEYLLDISYRNGDFNPISIDGFYGKETAEAVRGFQRSVALPVTGTVGFETFNTLYRVYLEREQEKTE